MKNHKVQTMVMSALLCAIGIIIPMVSLSIRIEPMSFTLASHVALFIAMFISPVVGLAVSLGTTLGFLLKGFSIIIVLRALSHIVFVMVGALLLKKRPELLKNWSGIAFIGLLTAVIHAVMEVLVVTYFYFGGGVSEGFYSKGYVYSVLLIVGVGTVGHSIVDYVLSLLVWKPVSKALKIQ